MQAMCKGAKPSAFLSVKSMRVSVLSDCISLMFVCHESHAKKHT